MLFQIFACIVCYKFCGACYFIDFTKAIVKQTMQNGVNLVEIVKLTIKSRCGQCDAIAILRYCT